MGNNGTIENTIFTDVIGHDKLTVLNDFFSFEKTLPSNVNCNLTDMLSIKSRSDVSVSEKKKKRCTSNVNYTPCDSKSGKQTGKHRLPLRGD